MGRVYSSLNKRESRFGCDICDISHTKQWEKIKLRSKPSITMTIKFNHKQ